MKPFELYSFIIGITREVFNKRKLPYYLSRAKLAITNLHNLGWEDEDIKGVVIKLGSSISSGIIPNSYRYIIEVLINTRQSPTLVSVEDNDSVDYDTWIQKEIERINNVK